MVISEKEDGASSEPYDISAGAAGTCYCATPSRQLTCERNHPPFAVRLF